MPADQSEALALAREINSHDCPCGMPVCKNAKKLA